MKDEDNQNIVKMPIEPELDLHPFSPKDLKTLVPDYLEQCREQGIYEIRVIHGKGKGVILRTVHSILSKLTFVVHFHLADETRGSWGATIVYLKSKGS